MRILMKVNLPVEDGNKAARAGKLDTMIMGILAEQKPEAVYFLAEKGMRTGYIFLNMQDSSDIPSFAEPWFLAFNASIEMYPVMAPEDLMKAAPAFEAMAKKFG